MVRSTLKTVVFIAALMLSAVSASANSSFIMTFQGLGDLQPVGNFYNANYGVTFSSNFISLLSDLNGGSGNFSQTPLGTPAIFINGITGSPATGIMNVGPGFSNGINFFFTAGFTGGQTETVTIWSGANGTGTVLATLTLGNNDGSCTSPAYCVWSNAGVSFSGTAHSVTFSGPADELGVTDITLGRSTTAIPEPSSIYLLGTGIAGVSLRRLRGYIKL